ncbi:hypothetical protein U1Q18_021938 [Sarracenia purpurea var. burkii]
MEDQWGYCYLEEGIEELKNALLYTTLELETTILSAHEEIARKEDELIHLNDLLTKTLKERDEAQEQCQTLMFERVIIQQKLQHQEQLLEEELNGGGGSNKGSSSSDSIESITAPPPGMDPIPPPAILLPSPPLPPTPATMPPQVTEKLVAKKPLPENGKFLKAVTEAGPLLQTLLIAGPLPQWQHPPPQLHSLEIPPVILPSPPPRLLHRDSCNSTDGGFSKKRVLVPCDASDSSPNTKYQKVVQQSPLTNGCCSS